MGVVYGSGASLHTLEAVLKVESLAVEAALLAQGSVHLLLLLVVGLGRTDKRNADVGMNDAKVKDAEENGDIEEEDKDGSEDEDDGGNSEIEDSEDIAEDDEEDDGYVNSEERSEDEDDDDEEDDYDEDNNDDEDCYDDEDEDEDIVFDYISVSLNCSAASDSGLFI